MYAMNAPQARKDNKNESKSSTLACWTTRQLKKFYRILIAPYRDWSFAMTPFALNSLSDPISEFASFYKYVYPVFCFCFVMFCDVLDAQTKTINTIAVIKHQGWHTIYRMPYNQLSITGLWIVSIYALYAQACINSCSLFWMFELLNGKMTDAP